VKKSTVFERYLDWAARPGQPGWHMPVLVISTSIFLSVLFMFVFVWLPLWYFGLLA